MSSETEARAALDALGLLSPEDSDALRAALADADAGDARALYQVAASLAATAPPVTPSADLKRRLMARIAASPRPAAVAPPLSFVMRDEGWQPHPEITGIRFKQLALDTERQVATLLLDVAPGTVYPSHHHTGAEACYVISGDLMAGGRHLHSGDFHHAAGGSDHEPLTTIGGCQVLLVVDARDYLPA